MPPSSLYDILGIDKSASNEEVRKAYKRRALETHPDKLDAKATHGEKTRTEEQFRHVCEALEVLGDPQKRRAYDAAQDSSAARDKELNRRMKERQKWAQGLRDPSTQPQNVGPELGRPEAQHGQEPAQRAGESFTKKTIESERLKLRLKDRQEWAQKQEEQHRKRMESMKTLPLPEDFPHQELVTKLVKEMADALEEAIPGWLERKQRAEQIKSEQAAKAKLAG